MLRKVIDIIDVSSFFFFRLIYSRRVDQQCGSCRHLSSTSSYFNLPLNYISFVTLAFYVLLVSYCVSTQELTSPLQFSFSVRSTWSSTPVKLDISACRLFFYSLHSRQLSTRGPLINCLACMVRPDR